MTISYDVDDSVATITLQREKKLNALDYAMIDDLQRKLDVVAADDNIRAVLLTGAGDRAAQLEDRRREASRPLPRSPTGSRL